MINLNAYGNCATDNPGTGRGDCPIEELGDFKGLGALNKGESLDVATAAMDLATFKGLITSGKLHQAISSEVFEQNTPDNEVYTSSNGLKRNLRAGKPEYTITYMKGLCFHKALYMLQGDSKYDFIFYFEKGMLMAQDIAGAKIKGFDGGMFSVGSYKFQQGGDPEQGKAMLQLRSTEEFNTRWVYFPYDEIGFDASQIEGVIDTVVAVPTAPADTDTTVVVTLVDGCNKSVSYTSLFDEVADWTVTVNGVAATISAVAVTDTTVTLTIPALSAGQTVAVKLNGIVEDDNANLYKSNTASATVSA